MRSSETLTLPEIQKLFKKHFDANIPRTSIYYYIRKKDFPQPLAFGKPKKWSKTKVIAWFRKNSV